MKSDKESGSLLRDYFGLDGRMLLTFAGLVAGVLVVVTGIYVAIFGYDDWKKDMKQAGSMMVAGFNAPANGAVAPAPAQLAPASPIRMNPTMQAPSQYVCPAPGQLAPVMQGAAQYVCPSCGAVGLPVWTPNGAPTCPNCGSIMAMAGRRGASPQLAAGA